VQAITVVSKCHTTLWNDPYASGMLKKIQYKTEVMVVSCHLRNNPVKLCGTVPSTTHHTYYIIFTSLAGAVAKYCDERCDIARSPSWHLY